MSQIKSQNKIEEYLKSKADAKEITVILDNISEDLYRNIDEITSTQKRNSMKFEKSIENMNVSHEEMELRHSFANFGEGIKMFSSTLKRLNQSKLLYEKKINAIEDMKSKWATKKELENDLATLREEVMKKVV